MSGLDEAIVIGRPVEERQSAPVTASRPLKQLWKKRAWLAYFLVIAAIYAGWAGRHERNITAEDGLGYALGIMGASMMAALLIYPLRKRFQSLRFLGATRYWFRTHMILGIAGPILILYHSNFTVSSLNSRVALFCTLLVAGSGIVGRYLYAKIHNGLYGEKTNLRSLVDELHQSMDKITGSSVVMNQLSDQLKALDEAVLDPPANLFDSVIRPFRFSFSTRRAHVGMKREIRQAGQQLSTGGALSEAEFSRMKAELLKELNRHLKRVRRIAQLSFFERLFSLWHILHLPFFFMLVLSAVIHVLAVHMY